MYFSGFSVIFFPSRTFVFIQQTLQREVTILKVGLLGFGTVGKGVWEMLRSACALEPGPVLVRPGKKSEAFQVTELDGILSDPSVGAVVEVVM